MEGTHAAEGAGRRNKREIHSLKRGTHVLRLPVPGGEYVVSVSSVEGQIVRLGLEKPVGAQVKVEKEGPGIGVVPTPG